jgi:prepilin-type N-terminal cleavage/methylation domain-containing protein
MKKRNIGGFTLVELLVVIAIIGTLVGLLLPAVQSARESARRTSCSNNIRQLGLALHHVHDHASRFPAGWIASSTDEQPGWGWASHLLPQIEQGNLHDRIDFKKPLFSATAADDVHREVRETAIAIFTCPSDVRGPTENAGLFAVGADDGLDEHDEHDEHDEGEGPEEEHDHHGFHPVDGGELTALCSAAKANYVGMFGWQHEVEEEPAEGDGIFFRNSRIGFRQITDGSSKTILIGERGSRLGCSVWTGVIAGAEAMRARVVGAGDHVPNTSQHFDDFSSSHSRGVQFVYADASTHFLADSIDETVYHALSTRAGGEAASEAP